MCFYSDLTVKLDNGEIIKAHKFVLAARSDTWGVKDLSQVSEMFLSGKPCIINSVFKFKLKYNQRLSTFWKFNIVFLYWI